MNLTSPIRKINKALVPGRLLYGPSWIVLGVNNICNLHCKMCDVGVGYNESNFFKNFMGSKPINMPLELITKIIDQTTEDFPKCKLGYASTEPLIYPHLIESLYYANQKNIYTSITTNALNLKRYADGLIESGLDELNISLDGPQVIHNHIRGHKSSFQKAVEGIEYIRSQNQEMKIALYCVITEWNIGYLKSFVDYFKSFPISNIGFMHTNFVTESIAKHHNVKFKNSYSANASNMQEINIENMNLDLLWSEISELKSLDYNFPISFSPDLSSRELLEVYYHDPDVFIGRKCNDIFQNVMIKSNGDVIPAHGRCYNLTIGNIYQDRIKSIWNSEVISKFRKTVAKEGGLLPACSRCCSGFGK